MRYKLDADGYIQAVSFGCYLDNCKEYAGEIPIGYNSLAEWADYACIKAYYIDSNGNLQLDLERLAECRRKEAQEAIDYAPLIRKDLYETDEILDSQWIKGYATGEVIALKDIKTIAPRVKITGINPFEYNKFSIFTHGRNMMPCDAVSKEVSGVSFVKNDSGSLTISGVAKEDIEYTVSGGSEAVIFALKKDHEYYLNLGDLECELRLLQGDTAMQQYVGPSGLLNLSQSIEVSEVIIKIPRGKDMDITFFPQLEYGNDFTEYEPYKRKALEIDFSEAWPQSLYPSDKLYARDTLYVGKTQAVLDYVILRDGCVFASIDGREQAIGTGNVGLFSAYDTIYATIDAVMEIEYSTNVYDVNSLEFLQGKSTTTNQFRILKDGSIEAHNGYFSGKIEANSGEIGSFAIGKKAICSGKNSFDDDNEGIYIGTDGISIGKLSNSKQFKISRNGDIDFNGYLDIRVGSSTLYSRYGPTGVTFGEGKSSLYSEISYSELKFIGSYSTIYSSLKYDGLTIKSNSYTSELTDSKLSFQGGVHYTRTGIGYLTENALISFGTNEVKIGTATSKVGFFGDNGSAKKTIASVSSSATAQTIAAKVNEIITALQAYNLIG